jgi:uncharacterized protein (TIGR02246 family)
MIHSFQHLIGLSHEITNRGRLMKKAVSLALFAGIAFTMAACNQAPDTHDADVQAIKTLESTWNQDYEGKSPDKLAAYYTDDAVLMAPGMEAASGKDAIHKMIAQMVTDPALSLKFQASKVDAAKSGDVAFSQGAYTMTMTDPNTKQVVNDHGSYVTVYHKQTDGTWKVVSDIATSAVPPPAPAPDAKKKK